MKTAQHFSTKNFFDCTCDGSLPQQWGHQPPCPLAKEVESDSKNLPSRPKENAHKLVGALLETVDTGGKAGI